MASRSADERAIAKVAVIGDLVLDLYQINGQSFEKLGCAGNIVASLDTSRLDCALYSSFAAVERMSLLLNAVSSETKSIVCSADGNPNFVYYAEKGGATLQLKDHPKHAVVDHRLSALEVMLASADIVIVCDHRLGTLTPEVREMARHFARRCQHSYVDCRYGNYTEYAGFESILPNPTEYAELGKRGLAPRNQDDLRRMGFRALFQKRGSEGVLWIENDKRRLFRSHGVDVVDDFGAGDYFIAEIVNAHGIRPHSPASIQLAMDRASARLAQIGGGLLKSCRQSVDCLRIPGTQY